MTTASHTTASDRALTITRTFDAPPSAVFEAWTEPAQAKRWMGPRGFTAAHLGSDLQPGGKWRMCLKPDKGGKELWQGGTYREITPPKRLSFSFAWDGDHGLPGNPTIVTISFDEQGSGRTRMTFQQGVFESLAERESHREGWNSTFDRLAEYLRAT